MIKKIEKESMGSSNLGWLESRFHFSFAQYYNPENINFGALRVLNDDIILPQSGFDTHPHQNMEIVTYVTKGELTHKDSMGNEEVLRRGEVQYLSAGDGIYHSEYNNHPSEDLKLLQIWIIPPKNALPRLYGSHRFKKEERENRVLNIVSSQNENAKIKLYQDVNFYVCELSANKTISHNVASNRQIYFVQIEGSSQLNGVSLQNGDACEITKEQLLEVKALENSHFLFIELV